MRISDWSSDVCSSDLNGSTGKVKRRSPDLSGASGAAEEQHQIVRGHRAAFGEGQSGIAGGRLDRFSIAQPPCRSEEHTSELQSLMRISYAVFCLKKKKHKQAC